MHHLPRLVLLAAVLSLISPLAAAEKLKVLLIDGQNNHAWRETSPVLVSILEKSGRFEVSVSTSPEAAPRPPRAPQKPDDASKAKFAADMKAWEEQVAAHKAGNAAAWAAWKPDFAGHDVVVSNYNGEIWPESRRLPGPVETTLPLTGFSLLDSGR
jgi:hypothetical protein